LIWRMTVNIPLCAGYSVWECEGGDAEDVTQALFTLIEQVGQRVFVQSRNERVERLAQGARQLAMALNGTLAAPVETLNQRRGRLHASYHVADHDIRGGAS
jgi:hypothetical protein